MRRYRVSLSLGACGQVQAPGAIRMCRRGWSVPLAFHCFTLILVVYLAFGITTQTSSTISLHRLRQAPRQGLRAKHTCACSQCAAGRILVDRVAGASLKLRGGMDSEDTATNIHEEDFKEEKDGLCPGKWDTWVRMRDEPSCDFNVTDDIVNKGSKAEQLAFERKCDEELERHWARIKRIREEDVANNRTGCRHVADNEYCVRKSDGRIWKYRYQPDLYSGCGSSRDDELRMPVPVDFVDPDYLGEIAEDLDRRDMERMQARQDFVDAHDRQEALEEALAWFNGTRRDEYEAGEAVWWRQIVKANASGGASDSATATSSTPAQESARGDALEEREGPEAPPLADAWPGAESALEEESTEWDKDEQAQEEADLEHCSSTRAALGRATSVPKEYWRQPGELPRASVPPPDFTSYGQLPAGYSCRDAVVPELTEAQAQLYERLQREHIRINGVEEEEE